MNILVFTLLLWLVSALTGFLGALTGLGGGVLLVPVLTLVFGVDLHYAIGATVVSVIATSSGAAAAYVKEGFTNIRIGMFLEIATTLGAVLGAFLLARVSTEVVGIVFGLMLLFSAYHSWQSEPNVAPLAKPDKFSALLKLNGSYPTPQGERTYQVYRVPAGFGLMAVAGALSGLLGIGSGAMKVLALDQAMRIPFKVSTTTSNFMIGVTAAATAGIYFKRGYIDPGLAMPVMLGVLLGSTLGAKALIKMNTKILRLVFSVVIAIMAIEMIVNALTGRI
ncbi:MAG TPA: sulfite exporter TauE/SafE family protein [Candidatus Angelobacter sp.]|nr:sulfite exporter TauE/SafE family protein [Candidatus Angelobacter sp.]